MAEKIRILYLSANPADAGFMRLDYEARGISEKIERGVARDKFEIIQQWALKPSDLQRVLNMHRPHIVHFSGHGSIAEEVILEDSTGKSKQVSKEALATLFTIFKDDTRVIFFDACYSNAQAEALADTIDYIIGTSRAIGHRAATTFAAAFYLAIASERSIREAFELAKLEISLIGISGVNTLKLLVREGVNAMEPFLKQEEAGHRAHLEKLKLALAHLESGDSSEDERRIIRQGMADGSVILEQLEGVESQLSFPERLSTENTGRWLHLRVDAVAYPHMQEQLYPPPPGIAPPLPGLSFIGREVAITEVKSLLGIDVDSAPNGNVVVVRGWPGVGKTTLACMIGRDPEVLKAFPDGVLWTSLGRSPELMSVLAAWGRALGTDELLRTPTLDEATLKLANILSNKRMLLIVDDVWHAAHARPFLSACADTRCALLVTTRMTGVAEDLTISKGSVYLLPVLNEDNSLKLLRHLAPSVVQQYPEECRVLVRELEYLPLGLHVAGRQLNAEARMGLSVIDLMNGLRKEAKLFAEAAPLDRAEGAVLPSVAALLQRSTDFLDEPTREYFMYLGVFAPKPATFDLEAMSAVWGVQDPSPIVRTLIRHGLLEPVGADRFQIHALLAQHARSLISQ